MNIFGHDFAFWFGALGAAFVKTVLSPWHGFWRSLISVSCALFCSIVFTEPVLNYLNMDPASYKTAFAAIIALTGEGIIRWVLQTISEPAKLASAIKTMRGK